MFPLLPSLDTTGKSLALSSSLPPSGIHTHICIIVPVRTWWGRGSKTCERMSMNERNKFYLNFTWPHVWSYIDFYYINSLNVLLNSSFDFFSQRKQVGMNMKDAYQTLNSIKRKYPWTMWHIQVKLQSISHCWSRKWIQVVKCWWTTSSICVGSHRHTHKQVQ